MRDFKEEYTDFIRSDTPDFWNKIQDKISALPESEPQAEDSMKGKVISMSEYRENENNEISEQNEQNVQKPKAAKKPRSRKSRILGGLAFAAAGLLLVVMAGGPMLAGLTKSGTSTTDSYLASGSSDSVSAAAGWSDSSTGSSSIGGMLPAMGSESKSSSQSSWMNSYAAYEDADYDTSWDYPYEAPSVDVRQDISGERYAEIDQDGFSLVAAAPLSTFALDVDTASYANVRRMIENGYGLTEIPSDAVRIEEFLNYFKYNDINAPEGDNVFGVTLEVADCLWNPAHKLLYIGAKTEDIDLSEAPAENLTFLIDVSGSMSEDIELLKKAFIEFVETLDDDDRVSIVTYASGVHLVLDGSSDKNEIISALENLYAGGSTNGEGGIQLAYEVAKRNFIEGANNRVLMATDGDLNVGISEPDALKKFISQKKDQGIFLSVLGFGWGNTRDDDMEALADNGNGNYHYIDSILEARKVLIEEMGGSLHTVAKDAKFQVEFNPAVVNAYRQLGYENRRMDAIEFRDDAKDGGEVGAGESVVVLYEIIPAGSEQSVNLKYGNQTAAQTDSDDYGTLYVRYKAPDADKAVEHEIVISKSVDSNGDMSDDMRFASAVAEFALVIRDDAAKGSSSLADVKAMLGKCKLDDDYKMELPSLIRLLEKRDY